MLDFFKKVLRIRKVLLGRDFYQIRQAKINHITFGNRFADWTFCPDKIHQDSVVYSFGVGGDISFDAELIKHYNLQIFAFDPAPESIRWIKDQVLPENFHFYPFGLANKDGSLEFMAPDHPGYSSLRITGSETVNNQSLTLEVRKLSTILNEFGHRKIDILKMDIEGAEYLVIDDIASAPARIDQVLIEFHHRFEQYNVNDTRTAIKKLNQAGYFIFNVSQTGEEYSFIKLK
jgi:FkbM family methyltransferase